MNLKISQLTATTQTTRLDWVIKNNSGETVTNKAQLRDVLGFTNTSGNSAVHSASYLTSLGTTARTESAIAIGNGAEATSPYSIAIGYQARNNNRDGTRDYYMCIGYQANAVQGGTAIGKQANSAGSDSTAIGANSFTAGNGSFAVGNNAESYSTNGVAIGKTARDHANQRGIAIGNDAYNQADYSTVIGYNSSTAPTHSGSTVIGYNTQSQWADGSFIKNARLQGVSSYSTVKYSFGNSVTVNMLSGVINILETLTTSANFNLTLTNLYQGGRYTLIFDNTGTWDINSITATGRVGETITLLFDGGQKPLEHNGYTKWEIVTDGFGNGWVNQTKGYS